MDAPPIIIGSDGFDLYNNTVTFQDPNTGLLVKMDLGQGDVHIDSALSNFATTFRPAGMVADIVAPPVIVARASDKFFQFDPKNTLALVDGTQVAAGADYPTISPALSNTPFQTFGYTLGCLLPTEVISNADAPLNLPVTAVQMVQDRLLLNRENRVKTLAFNTASFVSGQGLVINLGAAQKWNGGSSSDPVRNIRAIREASLMPVTHTVMDLLSWHAFTENPAVQKYIFAKNAAAPLPGKTQYEEWGALLDIPTPVVAQAKAYNSVTNTFDFLWKGSTVLVRTPPGADLVGDNMTFKTFRWNGAGSQRIKDQPVEAGGTVTGGWIVRKFFNPYRGPQGTHTIVVTHNDAEQITGGYNPTGAVASYIGGVIVGTYQ